jgi:hypothetical protein
VEDTQKRAAETVAVVRLGHVTAPRYGRIALAAFLAAGLVLILLAAR